MLKAGLCRGSSRWVNLVCLGVGWCSVRELGSRFRARGVVYEVSRVGRGNLLCVRCLLCVWPSFCSGPCMCLGLGM